MTEQFIFGQNNNSTSQTATRYSAFASANSLWNVTENQVVTIVATGGVISNFKVRIDVAPGAGKSRTFTIRRGSAGGAMADTALSVVIADLATESSLDTDEVAVVAGDKITISSVPSGTPAVAVYAYWTCQFTPTTTGETILLGSSGFKNAANNQFYSVVGINESGLTTEFIYQNLIPTIGVLKNFYVELTVAPGAGNSHTFTVRKNGVATSLVVTISGTSVTGSDLVNTVSIAAEDKLSIIDTTTGTPSTAKVAFGSTFLPDSVGEYFATFVTQDSIAAPNTEFATLNGADQNLEADEAKVSNLSPGAVIAAKKMYVNLATAPGVGKELIFTLRDDSANTPLTVTISGANTSGNVSTYARIVGGSLLANLVDATNGPVSSGAIQISILFSPLNTVANYIHIGGLYLPYEDLDGTKELHVLLKNLSSSTKAAHPDPDGAVVVEVEYVPAA